MTCLELFFALFAYIISFMGIGVNENKTTIPMKVIHAIMQKISSNINKLE